MTPTVVRKPWGKEYLCYRNEEVAIWTLHINGGAHTSLHCHPKKNTALIVLEGSVHLEFIRGAGMRMAGLDKINIFRGRFHRTTATSLGAGATLLEVETPENKKDIVRLEDGYGRADQPIEDATEPLTLDCLQINPTDRTVFAGCSMYIIHPHEKGFTADSSQVLVTLSGGFENGLVPPGDAIDAKTLLRFMQRFPLIPNTQMLYITKLDEKEPK